MPTIELLKKYHLMQFAEVTKAVRYSAPPTPRGCRVWTDAACHAHTAREGVPVGLRHSGLFCDPCHLPSEGSLLLLNEALAKHETFFIRCGIFLILEKLKIITYRNLFKKV